MINENNDSIILKFRNHAKFIVADYVLFSILTFGSLALAIYFVIVAIELKAYWIIALSVVIVVFATFSSLLSLLHSIFAEVRISASKNEVTYYTPFMIKKKLKIDKLIIKYRKTKIGYLYYVYDGDKEIFSFGHEWNTIQELLLNKNIMVEEIPKISVPK